MKKGLTESRVVLPNFLMPPIHREVMKIFPKIATGSIIGYETNKMPTWDEAENSLQLQLIFENWSKVSS